MESRECSSSTQQQQQPSAYPINHVEGGIPSSCSATQEECTNQSMYCKEVIRNDTEFSFEELRAERYFKQLNEKFLNLKKVKEELNSQIEQKQKLIQGRDGPVQHQQLDESHHSLQTTNVSAPVVPTEAAPLETYNQPEISRNSGMGNSMINHEDMGQGTTDLQQRSSQASNSFAIYNENVLPEKPNGRPNTRTSSMSHKSLKLPPSILKSRQPASECPSDKDASLSRSEEAIVNAHRNKTLCRSPDDTCDFVCAAQLASTPFGGPGRQNSSVRGHVEEPETLSKTGSVIFKEPSSEVRPDANKLSPIQEISHEWGYMSSLASTYPLEPASQGMATANLTIKEIIQPPSVEPVAAPNLETANPCSLEVRKALFDNVDLTSMANFSRKVGPLPDPDDLFLGGETLVLLKKLDDQGMYLYRSSDGGNVLVKVDESAVPWHAYINSQLRARLPADLQHCHAQSTCYLYENGSLTLWQVPEGQTIQECHMDRMAIPFLAVRLLEMVKQMHSCQLVHGALQPDTLMVCHSCEDTVICTDFSHSLDLKLQTDVKTVQSLPSAQVYIKQGLLLPSASPYQLDLCGIAEIVHLLLFGKNMQISKEGSYWRLAEEYGSPDHSNLLGPFWQDFFHKLLNPEDNSTKDLSNLINNVKTMLNCPVSL